MIQSDGTITVTEQASPPIPEFTGGDPGLREHLNRVVRQVNRLAGGHAISVNMDVLLRRLGGGVGGGGTAAAIDPTMDVGGCGIPAGTVVEMWRPTGDDTWDVRIPSQEWYEAHMLLITTTALGTSYSGTMGTNSIALHAVPTGIATNDKVDIYWATGCRYQCNVASVSGSTVSLTVSSGSGDTLPTSGLATLGVYGTGKATPDFWTPRTVQIVEPAVDDGWVRRGHAMNTRVRMFGLEPSVWGSLAVVQRAGIIVSPRAVSYSSAVADPGTPIKIVLAGPPAIGASIVITPTCTGVTLSAASLTFTRDTWDTEQTLYVKAASGGPYTIDLALTIIPDGGGSVDMTLDPDYAIVDPGSVTLTIIDATTASALVNQYVIPATTGTATSYQIKLGTATAGTITITPPADVGLNSQAAGVPLENVALSGTYTNIPVMVYGGALPGVSPRSVVLTHTTTTGDAIVPNVTIVVTDTNPAKTAIVRYRG